MCKKKQKNSVIKTSYVCRFTGSTHYSYYGVDCSLRDINDSTATGEGKIEPLFQHLLARVLRKLEQVETE